MIGWGQDTPVTVAGISHIHRFKFALATGRVAPPRRPLAQIYGQPAQILAGPAFMDQPFAQRPVPTILFVPDFRMGNGWLNDRENPGRHTGIDKSLISRENDQEMLELSRRSISAILSNNPECRLIYWCLAGREAMARHEGRYFKDGEYRHPSWNLDEVEEENPACTIRLNEVIGDPRSRALFIDESAHPSWLGYALIRQLIDNPEADAVKLLGTLLDTLVRPVIDFPHKTVLTGRSVWIERLRSMVELGLIGLGPNARIIEPEEVTAAKGADVVFVSRVHSRSPRFEEPLDALWRMTTTLAAQNSEREVQVVLWEAHAIDCAKRRGHHDGASAERIARLVAPHAIGSTTRHLLLHGSDMELPNDPAPSVQGIEKIVRRVGGFIRQEPFPA